MGDIYAAASLTIIAMTGDNSTCGLSRVSQPDCVLRTEQLGNQHITFIPGQKGIELMMNNSPRALRVWTLQEGILSKRRLIVSDHQAIFVCNTSTRFEMNADRSTPSIWHYHISNVGWLPPRRSNCQVGQRIPLKTAMDCLSTYSGRVHLYDTDAINAIIGALNTLRKHSLYQLWGVPFPHKAEDRSAASAHTDFLSLANPDIQESGIALLWGGRGLEHRVEFASWSQDWVMRLKPADPPNEHAYERIGVGRLGIDGGGPYNLDLWFDLNLRDAVDDSDSLWQRLQPYAESGQRWWRQLFAPEVPTIH